MITNEGKKAALELMIASAEKELEQYERQLEAIKATKVDIEQSIKELKALLKTHREELKSLSWEDVRDGDLRR